MLGVTLNCNRYCSIQLIVLYSLKKIIVGDNILILKLSTRFMFSTWYGLSPRLRPSLAPGDYLGILLPGARLLCRVNTKHVTVWKLCILKPTKVLEYLSRYELYCVGGRQIAEHRATKSHAQHLAIMPWQAKVVSWHFPKDCRWLFWLFHFGNERWCHYDWWAGAFACNGWQMCCSHRGHYHSDNAQWQCLGVRRIAQTLAWLRWSCWRRDCAWGICTWLGRSDSEALQGEFPL